MSRATATTPLSASLAQSRFAYTSVIIVLSVHLICTYVMAVLWRRNAVTLSWRQFKASAAYVRPSARTANREIELRRGALESR